MGRGGGRSSGRSSSKGTSSSKASKSDTSSKTTKSDTSPKSQDFKKLSSISRFPSILPYHHSSHYFSPYNSVYSSNNTNGSNQTFDQSYYLSSNNSSHNLSFFPCNISSSPLPAGCNQTPHSTNSSYNSSVEFNRSEKFLNITSSNNPNISILANMHMTDQQRLEEARSLAWTLDKLSRSPKRFTPSAPMIIPITMLIVTLFALICLVIKLFMNYLNSKGKKSQKFGLGEPCSSDLPTTPEMDQTSLATTASMKTRGSLRHSNRMRKNKLPPVSLYQMKQKQSPKPSTSTKLRSKAAMKAMAKASKSDPNRSSSHDDSTTRQEDDNSDLNINNDGSDSPTNMSQRSFDTEEIQVASPSGLAYAAAPSGAHLDDTDGLHQSASHQPEVHIVQIRDLEDNVQHSHYPQTESEI